MKQHISLFLVLAALLLLAAVWSTLLLAGPKQQTLDQHVQSVASQLKCVVCQGESVADSTAALAQQMRLVICEQLQQGKTDQEILNYFAQRYGDQIVWSPPWQGFSLLIWLVPIIFWLGGLALIFFLLREWRAAAVRRSLAGSTNSQHSVTVKSEAETDAETQPVEQAVSPDLERYRAQLEAELAAEDVLFRRPGFPASY